MFNLLNIYNNNHYMDTLSYPFTDIDNEICLQKKCVEIENDILTAYSYVNFDKKDFNIYKSMTEYISIRGNYNGSSIMIIPCLHREENKIEIRVHFFTSENLITKDNCKITPIRRCRVSSIR